MRKTINLLLGALLVVFAASCKKSETPEPQYQTDIYVAGYEEGDIYDIAQYWKNGKVVTLGKKEGSSGSGAYSVFVTKTLIE